ncbi:multi-pass transmembrane protein [Babesia ovis]|uniref:Multi-pass transmembrane protein n=1 Tax=Babesia ovis TaxID=5869 RepID=A0A9W5TBS6_BABOV|nr:multi-pass transmembrane protein [Babesia ovis]
MYFTYVVRPGEAPESRGPQFEPVWEFLMNYNLRAGFALQLVSFLVLAIGIYNGGKDPFALLTFFRALPENFGVTPFSLTLICHGGFIVGTLLIMSFIQMSEDDSSIKQCRGYRAGTKFLLQATSFGAVSWCLSMITFLGATYHFGAQWMEEQIGDGSNWLIYFSSRLFDAFALLLYAGGCFFLETYHSEGTSESWGWLCGLAFMAAGIFEVLALNCINSGLFAIIERLYTFSLGIALSLSALWALIFEPVCHRYDVKLTQSALRNEYYKSRNAMAFYGPAVVDDNGDVDIAAATEQVQNSLAAGQMMVQ